MVLVRMGRWMVVVWGREQALPEGGEGGAEGNGGQAGAAAKGMRPEGGEEGGEGNGGQACAVFESTPRGW